MTNPLRVVLASSRAEGLDTLADGCGDARIAPVACIAASEAARSARATRGVAVTNVIGVDELAARLRDHHADVMVCYGFPWRLPEWVLRLPRLGVLNVHTSVLPRHRGPMPIHWALLRGEAQTGVTIHWMTGRFDAGPIMARYAGVPLSDDMDDVTADGLIQELDLVARGLLPEALNKAAQGSLGAEQNEQEATYEPTMVSELATADWSRTAQEVRNVIRARRFGNYDPPGPIAEVAGRRISVLRTSLLAAAGLPVRCRDRPLWITKFIDLPNSE